MMLFMTYLHRHAISIVIVVVFLMVFVIVLVVVFVIVLAVIYHGWLSCCWWNQVVVGKGWEDSSTRQTTSR